MTAEPGKYRYRIKSTGRSSRHYGPCEVCNQHCGEVHLQVEEKAYRHDEPDGTASREGWTRHECNSYFGHESCLLAKRRQGTLT